MNLPGTALEFLDALKGCLAPIKGEPGFDNEYTTMPIIHCHCFTRELDPDKAQQDMLNVRPQPPPL
jgi:tRNA (guanine37-N1)-methyltransferase